MTYYCDNIAISDIVWDCMTTQLYDNDLPGEIKITEIPKDIITECCEQKNTDALIDYLSGEYGFCVSGFSVSDDLMSIINKGYNLFEVNTQIQGYVELDEYTSEMWEEGDFEFDPGVLHNIEVDEELTGSGDACIRGTYSFGVVAKNKKEAVREARKVFEDHWNNGDVDCGDANNTEQINYSDGDKAKYRISDCIKYNKDCKDKNVQK